MNTFDFDFSDIPFSVAYTNTQMIKPQLLVLKVVRIIGQSV